MPTVRTNTRNNPLRGRRGLNKVNNSSGVNLSTIADNKSTNTSTIADNKSTKKNNESVSFSSLSSATLASKSHSTPTTSTIPNTVASVASAGSNAVINSSLISSLSLTDQLSLNKQVDVKSEIVSSIVKEFTDKLERMRSEFQRQVTELHELINQLLNKLDANQHCGLGISELDIDVDLRIDAIERDKQMNDIVLDGIPISEFASDPVKAFNSLCTSVDIDVPSYRDIFCIKGNRSNDCGSIIIRLNDNNSKHQVLNAVKAKFKNKNNGHLSLRHVGINSDVRIFVHEGLTQGNYKIFRETIKLKKKHNFASVFTYNGRVFLKVSVDSQPVYIRCIKDLVGISAASASTSQK